MMRLLAQHSRGFDPALSWEQVGEARRESSPIFHSIHSRRRSPHTGREHVFTLLECPEWINVIAFTPLEAGGEILVVEQFRHGLNLPTLEIVGGLCEPDEDPLHAAQRELMEETGHQAERWISLGSCAPNPAVQTNLCHFYLALGCTSVQELHLDAAEELRVWAFPWSEWEAKLRDGEVNHALVMAAFLRLSFWEGWPELKKTLQSSRIHTP
jgi:8-oxo-dGTP pyrophosphatase MutT (NUDIX family)